MNLDPDTDPGTPLNPDPSQQLCQDVTEAGNATIRICLTKQYRGSGPESGRISIILNPDQGRQSASRACRSGSRFAVAVEKNN